MAADDDPVERLARLDSCAVSDALDRLGLTGAVPGIVRVTTARRIAGRVVTVRLVAGAAARVPTRHLCTGAVEAARPGEVIAVEQRSGVAAAGWGGILSAAAKHKGIAGVVVDGPVRDVDESRELDLPVYARAVLPLTARGRIREESFNEPIAMGDVTVRPGDLAIADGSGVVFVPADRAADVLAAAEEIAAREAAMLRAVQAGEPVGEVMGARYETMLEK